MPARSVRLPRRSRSALLALLAASAWPFAAPLAAPVGPELFPGTYTNEEQVYFDGEAGRKAPAWFSLRITREGDRLAIAEPDAFGALHDEPHMASVHAEGELVVLDYGKCQRLYRREGDALVAGGMRGTCRAPGTITRVDSRAITLSFPDGSTTDLRRARPVNCWVALRKRTPKPDGSEDWLFKRGVALHDQGGRALVGAGDPTVEPVVIRVRNVTWEPGSTNHPVVTLYVHKVDQPTRAESYSWAAPDSSRVGINLRWMQAGCVVGQPPAPAIAAVEPGPEIAPWTEAVISVRDIAATARLFVEAGGWRRTHHGKLDRAELDYWRLPAAAGGEFARYCAPQVDTGCLRFVRFDGVPQRPIRLAARAWDTGGIYSVMVRSDNVEALFTQAIALGWWAESEPIRFTYGASDLRNVVLQGPHGINLAAYERISPPFAAFPVGRISQAFNAMRMVRSRPVARDFFREMLGFQIVFDSARDFAEPARSNFGIPFNLTPRTPRAAAALQPVAGETGRLEVMELEGFEGLPVGQHASPPNLGILSVRYPVKGLAILRDLLARKAAPLPYQANPVPVGGLGTVSLLALRDPDGGLTEFYEAVDADRTP